LRSRIEGGKGNCIIKRDPTEILYINGDSACIRNACLTITNAAQLRKYDLVERSPLQCDHDYSDVPNFCSLSEYKKAAISYIAGYAADMVKRQLLCSDCCHALGSTDHTAESKFLALKDRGSLFKPTQSVIKVCEEAEQCFARMLASFGGRLPRSSGKAQ